MNSTESIQCKSEFKMHTVKEELNSYSVFASLIIPCNF